MCRIYRKLRKRLNLIGGKPILYKGWPPPKPFDQTAKEALNIFRVKLGDNLETHNEMFNLFLGGRQRVKEEYYNYYRNKKALKDNPPEPLENKK